MAAPDVIEHLRTMERAIVARARRGRRAGARARRGRPRLHGRVGRRTRKIASLGVHVSRGVSTHGFAVNVENDLEPFAWVVACGLPDVRMTSLAAETRGDGERLACFRKRMAYAFCEAHGARQRLVTPRGSASTADPRRQCAATRRMAVPA